jgi:hypothetical protein
MASDSDKARENHLQYVYARDNGHRTYVDKSLKCNAFVAGKQWDENIEKKLKSEGKPVLTINKVFANLLTAAGEQIATSSDISFKPTPSGNEETANALTKMWISIANANSLRWTREEVFLSGAIGSRGFYDLRMSFDDNMMGEITIKKAKAHNIVIDPDAYSYDPDDWNEVFHTCWLSPDDILKDYPNSGDAAKELATRERPNVLDSLGYDVIDHKQSTFGQFNSIGPSVGDMKDTDKKLRRYIRVIQRQYKDFTSKKHFVDRVTGDMRVIPDTWERERIVLAVQQYNLAVLDKKVKIIRWRDSADDILLFDNEKSSYKHFTYVPYFPVFIEGQTYGLIENLLSPQELLNKATSQELHIVNTTANSGWKVKTGSLKNMTADELEARGAETGVVLELDDVGDADKITPNSIPTGLDRVGFKAEEHLKEIIGISDSKRGFDRADVAAKAIRAKQQAGSINLSVVFNNMLRTDHILARNTMDLMQTFYTEERVVSYTTNTLNPKTETVTVNQLTPEGHIANDLTIGEYKTVVTNVPARDTFEDQQFDEAVRMRTEVGIAIPDEFIIQHSHLQDKSEIIQAMKGGDGPSELEQQVMQLELALKQAEVEATNAKTMADKASAALNLARAQKESMPEKEGDDGENQLVIEAEKLAFAREKHAEEMDLKREEMEATLKMKQEELNREYELSKLKLRQDALIAGQAQRDKAQAERQKAQVSAKKAAKKTKE